MSYDDKEREREYQLNRRYGISLAEYDELAENGCNICGATPNEGQRRLHVDHCHETGKVRGVLCGRCNPMLGYAQDNPDTLRLAAQYLERTA